MPPLVSIKSLNKAHGGEALFSDLTLGFFEGEKVGLIGRNGTGKSTFLKILSGQDQPDGGELVFQKGISAAYVPQSEDFEPGLTTEAVLWAGLEPLGVEDTEKYARLNKWLGQAGLTGSEVCSELSGGYQKRLSILRALVTEPSLLLLDEPTNHLDLEGILWLETLLKNARFTFIVVSHDRSLLAKVPTRMIEIGSQFVEGYFEVSGNYEAFSETKERYLTDLESKKASLSNKLRREIEWLRRGPKARTTKARYRIDEAGRMQDELQQLKGLSRKPNNLGIDFAATERSSRRLIETINLGCELGGKKLFEKVAFKLTPGGRLGLLGPNGSGKSTLLKILAGSMEPTKGSVKTADDLRIVYFDQHKEGLNPEDTLKLAICPFGDSVVFGDKSYHVISWAKRFLFEPEQLDQPVSTLSGGEKARALIAKLMLTPADVLLLDEPTNDLDIPGLQVLEEALHEFFGAVVLITHDRTLLGNVATQILSIGIGAGLYADLEQALKARGPERGQVTKGSDLENEGDKKEKGRKVKEERVKLSYNEERELKGMEEKVLGAEAELEALEAQLNSPEIAANPVKMQDLYKDFAKAQDRVERYYARWAELEDKQAHAAK